MAVKEFLREPFRTFALQDHRTQVFSGVQHFLFLETVFRFLLCVNGHCNGFLRNDIATFFKELFLPFGKGGKLGGVPAVISWFRSSFALIG